MRIGIIGLGKLGLPVALAIESKGYEVKGYDINPEIQKIIDSGKLPYREKIAEELIKDTGIKVVEIKELVRWSDIIFVAVQTPHRPEFEGITRLPDERQDFDYSYLKKAVKDLNEEIARQKKTIIMIVISTVLPGTMRREIIPYLCEYVWFGYNPFFIAMGTTVIDFLSPEFVLLGTESEYVAKKMTEFYGNMHNAPVMRMSTESAELCKVSYNTYITSKITIANMIMEMAEKTGANCDDITKVLQIATDRIVSPKYMIGGLGDSGSCHPRDCIALSWLAKTADLSYDFYEKLMQAREAQTEWLADLIIEKHKETGLPIVILGYSFKAGTNITTGSAVILLMNILDEKGISYKRFDPFQKFELNDCLCFAIQSLYFIGMNHQYFQTVYFPDNSIILDPWNHITEEQRQNNIEYIPIGRK